MGTRAFTLQELDYDNLPLDGTQVVYFDSRSSFGILKQNYYCIGEVVYFYGDIADSMAEAIGKGGYVTLEDLYLDDEKAIPLCIDSENTTLFKGCLWAYEHEFLPGIDTDHFPFQNWQYYQIAIEQEWCEMEKSEKKHIDNMIFHYHTVNFKGKTFQVVWTEVGATISLHRYTIGEDGNETIS